MQSNAERKSHRNESCWTPHDSEWWVLIFGLFSPSSSHPRCLESVDQLVSFSILFDSVCHLHKSQSLAFLRRTGWNSFL